MNFSYNGAIGVPGDSQGLPWPVNLQICYAHGRWNIAYLIIFGYVDDPAEEKSWT